MLLEMLLKIKVVISVGEQIKFIAVVAIGVVFEWNSSQYFNQVNRITCIRKKGKEQIAR